MGTSAGEAVESNDFSGKLAELREMPKRLRRGPDEIASQVQQGKGKRTARERMDAFPDAGAFTEIEASCRPRSIIFDRGPVRGREAFVYVYDFRVFGGAPGEANAGVIRRGAKLLHAHREASVPRVLSIPRKAHGGAYLVRDFRSTGVDVPLDRPTGGIAVIGTEGAVKVIHRRVIAETTGGADSFPGHARGRLASLLRHRHGMPST